MWPCARAEPPPPATQASCRVSLGETRYYDFDAGEELWLLSATSADGRKTLTVKCDDYCRAACGPTGLIGFELEDG